MQNRKPIGAYQVSQTVSEVRGEWIEPKAELSPREYVSERVTIDTPNSGWAAFDKIGLTWYVSAEEAATINAGK